MPRAPRLASAFLLASACSRHPVSPDDLVSALAGQGLHVEKTAELETKSEWVGAEMGVSLVLDYDESYLGIRFPAADLARAHCQEGSSGVTFKTWCIEPVSSRPKPETWKKVSQVRTL